MIKVRIFDKVTNEMLYKISDNWTFWEDGNTLAGIQDYLVLEQYTGLQDKSGNEVYVGDIVERDDSRKAHEIIFKEGFFGEKGTHTIMSTSWKIIGNIHENPELIKEQ